MSARVVDASVLAFALAGKTRTAAALRSRLATTECQAPHLIDAEIGNVLRKRVRAGDITEPEARWALETAFDVIDFRYPHVGALSEIAWTLREDLSFYDALYVALASRLGAPLMTSDRRLSKAPGLPCPIDLI